MAAITSSPGSKLGSDESDGVHLVLVGFPGSGKTETGYTLVGKQAFETVLKSPGSKAHSVVDDLPVTVRETTGFETITEFWELYNSFRDLEMRKVVFGLTIEIGRCPPGFTSMLHTLFTEKIIGEYLKHKTLLIFTKVDELLDYDEVDYELQDKFEEWLRNAKDINQLITSLNLNYCVIQNKQTGDKRDKEAVKVVKKLKELSQTQTIELDTFFNGNEYMNSSKIEVQASKDDSRKTIDDNNEENSYQKLIKKKFQINFTEIFDLNSKLVTETDKHKKTIIMYEMLLKHGLLESADNAAHALSILQAFEEINQSKCMRSLGSCNIL